jgi:hypothetical protein
MVNHFQSQSQSKKIVCPKRFRFSVYIQILGQIGLVVTERKTSKVYSVLLQQFIKGTWLVTVIKYDSLEPGNFDEFEIN